MEKWKNQIEAEEFAMNHPACMLDMEMGTGKTRVAIDVAFARTDCHRVLVVCPKAVIPVWRANLWKFAKGELWTCWDDRKGTIKQKTESLVKYLEYKIIKQFVVVNYDVVWRKPMGDVLRRAGFDMVILDESHRAKSAGSKVSKYLALLGKCVKYKMCLSGTPMANSPLDVYGQYRFLDPTIFGTNHSLFMQKYAVYGGPENQFVVGWKNQQELNAKFRSIAYTCKMSDVSQQLKLPQVLPPIVRSVSLPARDRKVIKTLNKEFVAECEGAKIVVGNVLIKMIRIQQITSGFCMVQDCPLDPIHEKQMNTVKEDSLADLLEDVSPLSSVVVFCVFRYDIESIRRAAERAKRRAFELSGAKDEQEEWRESPGAVLAVQIQAGAEGVDMTCANHAVYYSMPHSLALYDQSRARLYRPGQTKPVSFIHILAEGTIDESIYNTFQKRKDIIQEIKEGTFDFGYIGKGR